MSQRPLIEANPPLSDPMQLRKVLAMGVARSTAIGTGAPVTFLARIVSANANCPLIGN